MAKLSKPGVKLYQTAVWSRLSDLSLKAFNPFYRMSELCNYVP